MPNGIAFVPNQMHAVSFNKQEPNWCFVNIICRKNGRKKENQIKWLKTLVQLSNPVKIKASTYFGIL